jgi:hypothetical protein
MPNCNPTATRSQKIAFLAIWLRLVQRLTRYHSNHLNVATPVLGATAATPKFLALFGVVWFYLDIKFFRPPHKTVVASVRADTHPKTGNMPVENRE